MGGDLHLLEKTIPLCVIKSSETTKYLDFHHAETSYNLQ